MKEAVEIAGLSEKKIEHHRTGLILPVVTGPDNDTMENEANEWIMDPEHHLPTSLFQTRNIIRPTSACASIGTALSIGYSMIRHGQLIGSLSHVQKYLISMTLLHLILSEP